MYGVVRVYKMKSAAKDIDQVVGAVRDGFLPIITKVSGFASYTVALSETGELNLVELMPKKFSLLASLPVLEGKTWNNLCLYGRLLLVRNGQEAACYEMPLSPH